MEGHFLNRIYGNTSSRYEHILNIDSADDDNLLTFRQKLERCATVYHVIEFLMIFAQMITGLAVVADLKVNHPLAIWISVYAWSCVVSLPYQFWRLVFDKDDLESTIQIKINAVLVFVQMVIEFIFLIWSVVFLWVFIRNSTSFHSNTPLFWTCVVFICFGFIRYVIPLLICGVMCCCSCLLLSTSATSR